MTHALPLLPDIALPSGVARQIAPLWRTAALALAGFITRFGAPADVRRLNYCEGHFLWRTAAMLRRVQKIVRYILVVYAARLLKTAPPSETKPGPVARQSRKQRPVIAGDPATWRVGFVTPPRWRPVRVIRDRRLPENFARAVRNPLLVIAHRMESLRRVLEAPMPFITRLARRMRRDVFKVLTRNPKRKPPPGRRDYYRDLCDAREAARWALHPLNSS
ncbi:MAG: hypothetical protein FD160_1172 [Caulobacteraceae bacterium]|nr:MAG: hypothetical protein FD160_1172 [Caulobacteraceae bacterium]